MADPRGSVFWDHFVNGVPEDEVKVSQGWETEGVGKDRHPGLPRHRCRGRDGPRDGRARLPNLS